MPPYAIVTDGFVRTGGMEVANYALASYLARIGRSVDLVSYRAEDELTALPNVVFHRVPRAGVFRRQLLGATGLYQAAAVARRGGRVVVNGGNCPFPSANWVHYVHAAFAPIGVGWRVAKNRVMHPAAMLTERIALRRARLILANSKRTARDVIEYVGVPADRVHTVYLGVDVSRFRPASPEGRAAMRRALGWADDRPRVAFVGALGDRRKGFDILYDAWRALCASASWDADLVVIGRGAELPSWRARALRDGIAGRVTFLGFRSDVPDVLGACDALVAPTRYEPYGLGVHEALCCGLPSLVSARSGVAEVYPPSLARLLLDDPESPEAVATSLLHWRGHTAELRAETIHFSGRLRERGWDDMARDIVALCDAVD